MRHILQTLAMLSLALSLILIAFWVRSYFSADRLHGRAWDKESFLIASKQGRVTFLWFTSHGHRDWWQWGVRTYAVDDVMSFPLGDMTQYEEAVGFGLIHRPIYHVMRPSFQKPDGTTVILMGAATATLRGSGVIVPFWCLVFVMTTAGLLLIRRRPLQFSTRSLLTVITLLAVGLAVVITLEQLAIPIP